MTGNLQFKRGLKANLPSSAPSGMPLWCTDTKELYIGTDDGVEKVGSGEIEFLNLTELLTDDEITLQEDAIYRLELSQDITLNLPAPENTGIYHQILIQLTLSEVVTIDLGTTYFLTEETPDLSETGDYDLIYEFNPYYNEWFCGVLKKSGGA